MPQRERYREYERVAAGTISVLSSARSKNSFHHDPEARR
ncbi:hypothetical protein ACPOL_4510 [Acidisarcina polymorpha]|uniref:Uncharacterized protein n=1 Tax=Acidisarcina polymorpha TaxID=2211140 RepID=A0A2Z5G3S3_9BACT|nr:hypothetical protein ACPOL_4510 [Acidisarcina polymorpha]